MRHQRTDLEQGAQAQKAACALVVAGQQRGTGFLVRRDLLLTCAHVVREAGPDGGAQVTLDLAEGPSTHRGTIIALDESSDCALLRIEPPLANAAPLSLRAEPPAAGAPFSSYGYPLATAASGLLLRGQVHDPHGRDLNGRAALVLASPLITAGAELAGFSGSPVVVEGQVVGMLCQIIPAANAGAQLGIVYACASASLQALCPAELTGETRRAAPIQPPQSAYDPGWYISRPDEESRAHDALSARGAAVVLQAPELYGKTWLLQHLRTQLLAHGRVAYLDLKNFAGETRASLSALLREFARQILAQTVCPDDNSAQERVDKAWQRSSNPNDNLSWVLERQVLAQQPADRWLVLCVDGADALLGQPHVDDFFSVLRYFTQNAAQPPWTGLKLVMTLSTAPSLLVRDINQSPFNVAYTISVRDLDGEQVAQLAQRHGLPAAGCDPLIELVGGHPYLIRLALYEAARSNKSLAHIVAPGSQVFAPYLDHCKRRLRKNPQLYDALAQALADPRSQIDYDAYVRLHHAGFLVEDEETLEYRPRCALYRRLVRGVRAGGGP